LEELKDDKVTLKVLRLVRGIKIHHLQICKFGKELFWVEGI
jgi:hypothetical protein